MLRTLSVTVFCLSVCIGQFSVAEEMLPVKLPKNTGAIIRFAAPESTMKKVAEAADGLQKGWGNLVSGQTSSLGGLISNPTLAGVDKSKDWYIAVYPYEDEEPGILFIIPAKDVAEMEEVIPESYEFIKGQGYGLYTEDEDVAKEVKESLADKGDLLKLTSGKGMEIFNKSHLSVYFNLPVLMETYQAAWDDGVEEMLGNIKNGLQQAEGSGVNIEEISAGIEKLITNLEQGLDDSASFQLGLMLDDKGIKIHEFLTVNEGTETHKFLNANGPAQPKLLTRLPAEQLLYFSLTGAGENPLKSFMNEAVLINQKLLQLSDEKKEKVNEVKNMMSDIKFRENSLSLGMGDLTGGVLLVNGLFDMNPAENWADVLISLTKAIGDLEIADMKQAMSYEKAAETVGDYKVDLFKVTQEHNDENINQLQQQMMTIFYGPDGNTNRFTILEKHLLQSIGGGQAGISATIDAYNKNAGFASNSGSKRDRDQIQEKVNMLFMIDIVGMVKEGLVLAAQSGSLPIPIDAESLDELKLERSYLSVGISCEESGLHCLTNIPLLQIKNGVTFGMKMQNANSNPDF